MGPSPSHLRRGSLLLELAVSAYDWASAAIFLDRPATSVRHGWYVLLREAVSRSEELWRGW